MRASEKTQNSRRRAQVTLKIHHNSEGSCISWFQWIKFRTLCNSTCAASSLGSYPTPRYKIRIQYWCTEAGLSDLCIGSSPSQIPSWFHTRWGPSLSTYHIRSLRTWAALNRSLTDSPEGLPQRTPQRDPPEGLPQRTPPGRTPLKDGLCLLPPVPHLSLSPSSWQLCLHLLPSTGAPPGMVTSDFVTTKPYISLGIMCPRFPLCVWQLHGSDIPKIPLPSLVTPPSTISSFCDHSCAGSSSAPCPRKKSKDWRLSYKAEERLSWGHTS